MAAGKNPYLRYRVIHSCLSNRQQRYWTLQQLVEKLETHDLFVDKRSIERDLETMRHDERLGYRAPIAYNRREKGYHYTDPHFSIDRLPLNEEDLQALTLATNILHQYKDVRMVQQFEGVVDRISKVVDHLRQPQNSKLIAFENTPYYKGREFFDLILQAITHQQVLQIIYRKFDKSEPRQHVFHPYFLKEYRGRWYALGFSEARNSIIVLGLDRIEKLEEAKMAFLENKTLKPKEYFQHTLGVTLGKGPVEDIELWFSNTIAPYIKTQHIHHSQKTVWEDDNGLTISLKLIPNPELTQLILSYGAEVKVLKPLTLKESIGEIWRKAMGGGQLSEP